MQFWKTSVTYLALTPIANELNAAPTSTNKTARCNNSENNHDCILPPIFSTNRSHWNSRSRCSKKKSRLYRIPIRNCCNRSHNIIFFEWFIPNCLKFEITLVSIWEWSMLQTVQCKPVKPERRKSGKRIIIESVTK